MASSGFQNSSGPDRGIKVRLALIIAITCVFFASAGILFADWYGDRIGSIRASSVAALYSRSSEEHGSDRILPEFGELCAQNPDTAGRISIAGTPLNHIVVQAENNEYYLRRDFYGNYSKGGTVFLDFRSEIDPRSKSIIVYGHNLGGGSEAMFGTLRGYRKLSYYREHPVIRFDTLYENGVSYKIFAVVLLDADKEAYEAGEFKLVTAFASGESFLEYIETARAHSILDIPVDVAEDDRIISLVTCAYDIDDGRYVILGREVREGESLGVDTSSASVNKDVIMPDSYR